MPAIVYDVREGQKFTGDADLVVVKCWTCGITYAIPEGLYGSAKRYKGDRPNGWKLCCPLGHTWWYVGETNEEALRRQRDEARRQREAERELREHTERKLAAQKGATTKARKRHAAGICPVCARSFKQVRAHMTRMHPDFDPTVGS
jgi:hypothetical protein